MTFAPMSAATTAWVDRAVPEDAEVGALAGSVSVETRDALRLTEFFNASHRHRPTTSQRATRPTLASDAVRIAGGGVVVTDAGQVDADWIVAPRELELAGDVEAEGTVVGLRLWRVQGPLRVAEGRP